MSVIKYEWYGPVEGNKTLLRVLNRFAISFGEISIFVRRLSWIPLNYPCQLDGGDVFPADRILEKTSEDLQVLCGYWVNLDDLINLFELKDVNTADFEIYRSQSLSLIGSLGYFEWWIRQWDVMGQLLNESVPSTSPVVQSEPDETNSKMRYLVQSFEPSCGSLSSLSNEGLSLARNLSLTSTGAILRAKGFAVSSKGLALSEAFNQATSQADVRRISEDWFIQSELGHLSSISDISEPTSGIDARLTIPWGTIFFFNEQWDLRLAATKRRKELKWQILHFEC